MIFRTYHFEHPLYFLDFAFCRFCCLYVKYIDNNTFSTTRTCSVIPLLSITCQSDLEKAMKLSNSIRAAVCKYASRSGVTCLSQTLRLSTTYCMRSSFCFCLVESHHLRCETSTNISKSTNNVRRPIDLQMFQDEMTLSWIKVQTPSRTGNTANMGFLADDH